MRNSPVAGNNFTWLKPVVLFMAIALLITNVGRIALVSWQWDRVAAANDLAFVLLQGLRFDLVTLGLLIGIVVAVTPLVLTVPRLVGPWSRAFVIYLQCMLVVLVFMELSTPSFIGEYDIRPNRLFIEYLSHPKEVFSMLWAAYKVPLLISAAAVPLVFVLTRRWFRVSLNGIQRVSPMTAMLSVPVILLIATVAVRSTLDHRPVNPSTVAFSSDPMVNSLPLNSTYSLLYALYEMQQENTEYAYGDFNEQQVIAQVRRAMSADETIFSDPGVPTLHWQQATLKTQHPKNLVIIIEESLGASHVGRMGGVAVTPNLDQLAEEGIWFENLYATGTRSVRGLEAILAGFPPTTSRSVVKLSKAQRNFFTLGSLLERAGYETSFLYGGEAQFDNMRRFFANNGFKNIVDKHNIEDPVFYGSWGASDEDVFNEAHERHLGMSRDKPFFSVIFTTSNHSPWDFPEGRVAPFETPLASRNNAIQYADYALGEYIRQARASDYWQDTVFLVIADHSSRVYGAELVPVEMFHIPGLILGGGIAPRTVERIVSQIDMLPTLLSMIGVSAFHPAVGIDLTRQENDILPGRAVMQYGQTQAYMEEDRVVIMQRDLLPEQYATDGVHLDKMNNDQIFIDKAMNLAAWPWLAYSSESYQLPAVDALPARPASGIALTKAVAGR